MVKILETHNLNYKFFSNINISFDDNTFYTLVGSNNSGKTILFKLLTGLIMSNNCISCSKIVLNEVTKYEYIKKIGVVNTVNKKSFIFKKVIDELMFPLHNLNYYKGESLERINYVLEMFELEYVLKKRIIDLNICEQQMLLIVIALLHKPKVLLLDSSLDLFNKRKRLKIIEILRKFIKLENITIINFTSSLDEAMNGDIIMMLKDYKINIINKADIYNNDKFFYESGLEIPFTVDLSSKLKMYNVLNDDFNNAKDMVNSIWR